MKISLNFLPLSKESFSFKIYKKEILPSEQKAEDTFVYSIFSKDNEKTAYEVSLRPKDKFSEDIINSHDNLHLTKKFLYNILREDFDETKFSHDIKFKNFHNKIIITIEETLKGYKTLEFIPYFYRPTKQFGFLVDFSFSLKEDVVFDIEAQKHSFSIDKYGRSNKNYYSDKYHFIRKNLKQIVDSFKIPTTDSSINLEENFIQVTSDKLDVKNYLLNNNNQTSSQFLGIKNFGPYQQIDKNIKFQFVFEEKYKSFANDIYQSLVGKSNPGTFSGFTNMFKIELSKENVTRIPIADNSKSSLENLVTEIEKQDGIENEKIIVIYIEGANKEDLETSENYYFLKYQLTKRNIPLQVISYANLGSASKLKWAASNIALQIFAKLGGVPWIVKSRDKTLILGIGSAHKVVDDEIKKYFAYTVCLDSSGLYKKMEILSTSDNETNYLEKLKVSLAELLKSPDFSSYKKCALHLPFKIKRKEIDTIKETIQGISEIEFVVIKINTENKFFGYADNNTFVPYESTFIKLDNNEYLIWFEGLQYGKELVNKRTSNPVHIQFLQSPNKENYKGYLQDIINLSGANWRGFNSKSIPVSIYYSKIISEYSSQFEKFNDFTTEQISNIKPWFL